MHKANQHHDYTGLEQMEGPADQTALPGYLDMAVAARSNFAKSHNVQYPHKKGLRGRVGRVPGAQALGWNADC